MRLVDMQGIEDGANIVARTLLRVALAVGRHVGWRVAARVIGDAAVAPAEIPQLGLVRAMIPGKLVHEYDGNSGPGFLVEQPDPVVGGQMRHDVVPDAGLIAVRHARAVLQTLT